MSSLKQKLALFIAKRKYFNKNETPVNFNGSIKNADSFLIVLPSNAEDTLSASDIPAYFKIHKKNITLLGHKDILPIALETNKFQTISFDDESRNRIGLPVPALMQKIKQQSFDVVLDLNRFENQFLSILSNAADARIKIGFKKEKSDEYYNVQVANNQNNAEISYRNFLNSIQMF